jgi:hypothetical protein
MNSIDLLQRNLSTPMVLGFALGIVAALVKGDIKLPDAVHSALGAYLLLSIGLKGGAELSKSSFGAIALPTAATILVGITIPIACFFVLRALGRFGISDAAAIAAHYGSVSIVTFTAATSFLDMQHTSYEGFMNALVAFLEVPGILVAILLARVASKSHGSFLNSLHEVLTGKSNLLLVGGVVIGVVAGADSVKQVAPFFVDPFRGVLTLFLIDMGLLAAARFRDLKQVGGFLLAFALVAPIVNGLIGAAIGTAIGLSLGGTTVFATMVASASYIAAPVAVRIALPDANPAFYLTSSLAITFPFNLTIGIPLYHAAAGGLHS